MLPHPSGYGRGQLHGKGARSTGFPPLGETVKARVSTGVLFRAVSIASLDYDVEESFVLLERWLQEAALQRTGSSEMT